jgi:hypothetical protein
VRKIQRLAAVGALAAVTAVVGACGGGQQAATGNQTSEATATSAQAAPTTSSTAPSGNGITQVNDIFGPVCDQVPKQGPGSAQGMVNDPVATAASNNPLLTKLTAASEGGQPD